MSGSIHAEIPDQLRQQAQTFVRQGWASNIEEVINEALRRYLESHQGVLTENFIQENVEWGLHGADSDCKPATTI